MNFIYVGTSYQRIYNSRNTDSFRNYFSKFTDYYKNVTLAK